MKTAVKLKLKLKLILTVVIILAGSVITGNIVLAKNPKKAKNIILVIGDGMGVAQVYAGMITTSQPYNLLKFPYSGFSITYSADNYITDSGAGGTAISSGIKTTNGMIGVRPDSTPVESIVAITHGKGLATGVVSTSAITHATPASFVAHNAGRGNYEDIAVDFLNGTIDVFIGGGEDHFRKRQDGRDLTEDLKSQGFDVVYTLESLKSSGSSKIAGLLAKEHMPQVRQGREGMLEEMTRKAIQTLSKDKDGFFLMVEASMIDWGGHDRDIEYVTTEITDMDKAVGVALDFAAMDGKTLVVVTADHETGGLTLTGDEVKSQKVNAAFSTNGHTAVMVPIFSFGPGAELFSGIHDNTFFLDNFLNILRIKK